MLELQLFAGSAVQIGTQRVLVVAMSLQLLEDVATCAPYAFVTHASLHVLQAAVEEITRDPGHKKRISERQAHKQWSQRTCIRYVGRMTSSPLVGPASHLFSTVLGGIT
jgi:hypothetical protein